MIIWIILFAAIIIISFVLAFRSMRDYHEIPTHSQTAYSLYLIKNEANLTEDLLTRINAIIDQKRLVISFERLCKESKKALVIYGPVAILKTFSEELNLIELEDYALDNIKTQPKLAWEISSKNFQGRSEENVGFSELLKDLFENKEVWWQLILQPQCEKRRLQSMFKALIRVVAISDSDEKNQEIKQALDKMIKDSELLALPQAYSSEQILEFYQQRSMPQILLTKDEGHFVCSVADIKYLLS